MLQQGCHLLMIKYLNITKRSPIGPTKKWQKKETTTLIEKQHDLTLITILLGFKTKKMKLNQHFYKFQHQQVNKHFNLTIYHKPMTCFPLSLLFFKKNLNKTHI